MLRIEVNFSNGEFRAYPHVRSHECIGEGVDAKVRLVFGDNQHIAIIMMNKVNWMEIMDEE